LLDPAALFGLIQRERVECLELVPAVALALANHVEEKAETLAGIRVLAVGSDTVRGRLYHRLSRLVGPAGRVVNSYGLTEATIDSTYFDEVRENVDGDSPVPIGRPMAGTRTYVLDGRLEPIPCGVAGELFIAGCGLARGYLANPRLTAERFVPDPHGKPGSRMYATGDSASWRRNGVLALSGRRDLQVKVRGFRIELAEVEAVLVRHPDVREAVLAVIPDSVGERTLTAYVVPNTSLRPGAADLRRWLRERLPEPMVPSWYVVLDSFPLSVNGKLDRSALPQPGTCEADGTEIDYVPPRTIAEEVLAEIAADLLGRSRLGIHENFFEIGVDSIVGIQIVSRARQAGLALDPTHLFRHPTIAELAAAAESTSNNSSASSASPSSIAPFQLAPRGIDVDAVKRVFGQDGPIEDLYPLTPVQDGMLFHTLADPDAGHYAEQFVCRLQGDLDRARLEDSWHRVIARHPALRSSIHWTDFEERYQVVHRETNCLLEYHDWRSLSQSEQNQQLVDYLGADRRRGFELTRAPLSRLALVRLGDELHQLIWSIHHVVIDGWCLSILLQEMLHVYEALSQKVEPVLKPCRPFRDYVGWQGSQSSDHAQVYWKEALKGFTTPTPLGLDNAMPSRSQSSPEATTREATRTLPAELRSALDKLVRTRHLTLSTLIQGAWALLLSRYSGQSDVLFGVTVSGRPPELAGVESMVGMFINVLPVRVAVTEESDLAGWLRDLQATMVERRRYEAIPISQIQMWSELPPGIPLFESILIVQNLPFQASLQDRASRLGIASARYHERTHYPLTVTVVPANEMEIKISFDSRRFDSSAIERMLGHLCSVLEVMAAKPDGRLVDLPLMTQAEQERLVRQWDQSYVPRGIGDIDLDRLTEGELDSLMGELSAR
jgi:aryl carrier-like protein